MNALAVFQFDDFDVRTVVIDGEPWFVANDAARILGYANPADAIRKHAKEVAKRYPLHTAGGTQEVRILSEPDILRLIVGSRLPEAERFERFVFEEVLPAVRRTGSYTPQHTLPQNYAEALRELLASVERNAELEARVAEDAPKIEAYDRLMDADGYYSMESVAKMCGVGRTTLYRLLRAAGVIQPGSTLPYQKYMHHFVLTASSWQDRQGNDHPTQTTRVRPSGLPFIQRKAAEEAVAA